VISEITPLAEFIAYGIVTLWWTSQEYRTFWSAHTALYAPGGKRHDPQLTAVQNRAVMKEAWTTDEEAVEALVRGFWWPFRIPYVLLTRHTKETPGEQALRRQEAEETIARLEHEVEQARARELTRLTEDQPVRKPSMRKESDR